MQEEALKNYMLNEYDYLPKEYHVDDPEKLELIRKLALIVTDRRDISKIEDFEDNDPEIWCFDKIMNKEELRFMLSFEKKRVKKYTAEKLAEKNGISVEKARQLADGLCETGILEFDRENKKQEKQ